MYESARMSYKQSGRSAPNLSRPVLVVGLVAQESGEVTWKTRCRHGLLKQRDGILVALTLRAIPKLDPANDISGGYASIHGI